MKVVIAIYGDEIAPCFEAAKRFRLFESGDANPENSRLMECRQSGPIARMRLVSDCGAETLICNGIRNFYKNALEARGCRVYNKITGDYLTALDRLFDGKLKSDDPRRLENTEPCLFELAELMEMTREYLTGNGYNLDTGEGKFPVDFKAYYNCPECGRKIRVAVCCGGHLFNWEKEVRELHAVSEGYDAAMYVHAPNKPVEKCCRDFRINLLDPLVLENPGTEVKKAPIPGLMHPVRGHKKIYKNLKPKKK